MKTEWKLDDWLGAICYQGKYRFFLEHATYWVLDMIACSPSSKENSSYYRNGILVVDENPEEFLEAMQESEISLEDLRVLIDKQHKIVLADEDDYRGDLHLTFLVDFDKKLYVSMFFDVGYEEYVPQDWKGIYDDPLKYVPEEIRDIWQEVESDSIAEKRHQADLAERNM